METNLWTELSNEKREKAAAVITEFSAIAVTWNDEEKEKIFTVFTNWIKNSQEDYQIKPHQLVVISKMLQETAFADLIEWLPEDFEEWQDKEELMAMFFFGPKGLEAYRQDKQKITS